MNELSERTTQEIARLIGEGFTSGILDIQDSGARITWKLNIDVSY